MQQCGVCRESLIGKQYLMHDDKPTCVKCYEGKFAHKCGNCKKVIGLDAKDLTYNNQHYHDTCFTCCVCHQTLAGKTFVTQGSGFCCSGCYDKQYATKCSGCNQTIQHGSQKYEYSGKKYHHECFSCSQCRKPIGDASFVPHDSKVVCMPCYNRHFAQTCGICGEVLQSGGVAFQEKTFHSQCFVCTVCHVELAEKKFTTKEDKPYCQDCNVKLFAKICQKCMLPITAGLGQTAQYVTFEEKPYHPDCFKCTRCERSLLGEGFHVVEGAAVCSSCVA